MRIPLPVGEGIIAIIMQQFSSQNCVCVGGKGRGNTVIRFYGYLILRYNLHVMKLTNLKVNNKF